jgi:hypothetical protein
MHNKIHKAWLFIFDHYCSGWHPDNTIGCLHEDRDVLEVARGEQGRLNNSSTAPGEEQLLMKHRGRTRLHLRDAISLSRTASSTNRILFFIALVRQRRTGHRRNTLMAEQMPDKSNSVGKVNTSVIEITLVEYKANRHQPGAVDNKAVSEPPPWVSFIFAARSEAKNEE